MGGVTISSLPQVAPRSMAFFQVVTSAFTPTASFLELKIDYACTDTTNNRFLVDDVSIVLQG
jgi:hypothetical protein